MQDDVIFAYFTVKEALTFAARLRLKISEEEQDVKINTLIKDLGLEKCKDTIVGSIKRKTISGGERKRTAIGVELITDPSMILLDEPTSGLDSFMAKSICKLLQKLAHKQGKTIISTIHQPSS
jgi:ATP-binding cassette, subfamily G (WHITE), eye pigment precursor transporter